MTMANSRITVLMSVFNGIDFLCEAIESVLAQTLGDFEFLIIDDGSTEPVGEVISGYNDPRIRFIRQENMGLTRSLNRGLSLASGELVARMDADDVCLPDRLAVQLAAFKDNDELDLVGSFFEVIDAHGNLLERKEPFTDAVYRLWRLQFHNNYGHGSVMMRKRAAVAAGMYDERLRYAQDYDLWSRLSTKSNTEMIPRILYRYRLLEAGAQTSVRNYNAQLDAAIEISNRNLKACNPSLTDQECAEVRALYWEFQFDGASEDGIFLLPETCDRFCTRYGLSERERDRLVRRVFDDVREQMATSRRVRCSDRLKLFAFLDSWLLRREPDGRE